MKRIRRILDKIPLSISLFLLPSCTSSHFDLSLSRQQTSSITVPAPKNLADYPWTSTLEERRKYIQDIVAHKKNLY